MDTRALFDQHYFSKTTFVRGTTVFHRICQSHFTSAGRILEIGAGAANATSEFLAKMGIVIGLDVSAEVRNNSDLTEAYVYDGLRMPFPDESFELCVSNYVLEHVVNATYHFQEIFRILKPGGFYCFRTPNRWHYVTIASSLMPHSVHLRLANKLRALENGAHDPWPTVYRANTRASLRRLAKTNCFLVEELRMVEAEPSYGAAHAVLFYPMMAYERLVNFSDSFSGFRVNILGTFCKPF
jgi:SAM-dependent methyltransferase